LFKLGHYSRFVFARKLGRTAATTLRRTARFLIIYIYIRRCCWCCPEAYIDGILYIYLRFFRVYATAVVRYDAQYHLAKRIPISIVFFFFVVHVLIWNIRLVFVYSLLTRHGHRHYVTTRSIFKRVIVGSRARIIPITRWGGAGKMRIYANRRRLFHVLYVWLLEVRNTSSPCKHCDIKSSEICLSRMLRRTELSIWRTREIYVFDGQWIRR